MPKSIERRDREHSLHWLVEPLVDLPSYIEKPMFGCLACYAHGRMMAVLADGDEPWNGLMVPTEKIHQPYIRTLFPKLHPHPVLGKWLYISSEDDDFELISPKVVQLMLHDDPRIGVIPPKKKKRRVSKGRERRRKS